MNKKILVCGSVGAVVILILASFTSIVGFQLAKSTSTKDSPLFSIRTKQATQATDRQTISCNYIGKENPKTIPLPPLDERIASLQRIADSLIKMDDAAFNKFIASFISYLHHRNQITDTNIQKMITVLCRLRKNPELLKNQFIDWKDDGYAPYLNSQNFLCTNDGYYGICFADILELLCILFVLFMLSIWSVIAGGHCEITGASCFPSINANGICLQLLNS